MRLRGSTPIALAAALAPMLASPLTALADDPLCASLYPSAGPAGVDLQGACVANELVENYTSASSTPDMLWTLAIVLGAGWAAAVVVYAAWRFVSARAARRLAAETPIAFWLCESCRSFNADDVGACYKCRRPRPEGAPIVGATDEPPWKQRFGRPFGS